MRYLATILITILLSLPAMSVELFRYRGAAMDGGTLEYILKRCHWVKPSVVWQVKFTEWTRDDRLRHPVFLGIREDKSASEVLREKAS